jgi:RNA recognition motif-containing protein
MGKNLYVGNLSFKATADDLREVFGQYGSVTSAQIIMDRETGKPRGFGFVEMGDGAQAAIDALNGQDFQGRPLTVNEARPREDSRGGGGGGTRGGRSSGGYGSNRY